MRVKCISDNRCDNSFHCITTGNVYKVLAESGYSGENFYKVICEDGKERIVCAHRFEIVEKEKEMKEFLNKDKRKFIDLTDEEKLLIINEKMKGNVELLGIDHEVWSCAGKSDITFNTIYRTTPKPAKKLDMPWQFIKPEFKWAAMDNDGEVYLHIDKPSFGSQDWVTNSGYCRIDHKLNIDTTGVDWKTSLTQRPEGL